MIKFFLQFLLCASMFLSPFLAHASKVRFEMVYLDGTNEVIEFEIPADFGGPKSNSIVDIELFKESLVAFSAKVHGIDASRVVYVDIEMTGMEANNPSSLWQARIKPALFRGTMNAIFGTVGAVKGAQSAIASGQLAEASSAEIMGSGLAVGLIAVGGTGFVLQFLNKEIQLGFNTGVRNVIRKVGFTEGHPYFETALTTGKLFYSLAIEFVAVAVFYAGVHTFGIEGAQSLTEFALRICSWKFAGAVATGVGVGFVGQTTYEAANAEKTDRMIKAAQSGVEKNEIQRRSNWRVAWMSAVTSFNQISAGSFDYVTGIVMAATTGFGLNSYYKDYLERKRIQQLGASGGGSCAGALGALLAH